MLILVFLAPFFIAIAWLVYIDSNNSKEVEQYLSLHECNERVYYQSKYQSLCKNELIIIVNQFSIDLSSNEIINYKNIKDLSIEKKSIIVSNNKKDLFLVFENENQTQEFAAKLRKKIDE